MHAQEPGDGPVRPFLPRSWAATARRSSSWCVARLQCRLAQQGSRTLLPPNPEEARCRVHRRVERISTTVRCVLASSIIGTAATHPARRAGTPDSAVTVASIDVPGDRHTRRGHEQQPRIPGRTVPVERERRDRCHNDQTIDDERPRPRLPLRPLERRARSVSAMNDSQNANPAIPTVPPVAVATAHRRDWPFITAPSTRKRTTSWLEEPGRPPTKDDDRPTGQGDRDHQRRRFGGAAHGACGSQRSPKSS